MIGNKNEWPWNLENPNMSEEYKVILVHIAKCAGNSLYRNLGLKQKERGIFTILQLKEMIPAEKFNSYTKITAVRNPWDRMVSLYQFRKQEGHDKWIYGDKDYGFKEWLLNPSVKGLRDDSILMDPNFYKNHLPVLGIQWFGHNKHWLPQLNMISDTEDNILVDIILKTETLSEDWQKFAKHIKRDLEPIKRLNTTEHKKYTEYYDDETIEYVSKLFYKDISAFNYSFGN